ncbi:MAG: hypothetical protein HC869_01820 [Rhodospirillales bacterium]|nr:hypothetical protein [Rhodospirillales bacterium]
MLRRLLAAAARFAADAALAEEAPEGGGVEINGMRMYYEVSGKGKTVIVLHGAFMTIPMLLEVVERLAETHRFQAQELQGHGRAPDIDRPITYPNLAGQGPRQKAGHMAAPSSRRRIRTKPLQQKGRPHHQGAIS